MSTETIAALRDLHKPHEIRLPSRSIFNGAGTYIGEVGGGTATICAHCHSEFSRHVPGRHCPCCADTGDGRRDRECECDCRACDEADHDVCDDNCGYRVCEGINWANPKKMPFSAGVVWPCRTAALIYSPDELAGAS